MRQAHERENLNPTKTSKKFSDEVEDYIQQELMTTHTKSAIFAVYQKAFQILVDKFSQQSPAMILVKNGYDSVIEDLKKQNQIGNSHRLIVQKSLTSLNNELMAKQAAFNKKKQGFQDLIESIKSTISELKEEIINLKETIATDKIQYAANLETANKNQNILNNLLNKIAKKQEDQTQFTNEIRTNTILRGKLEIEAKEAEITLSNVLESISNSNRDTANTKVTIEELENVLNEFDNKINMRNDELAQMAEEKDIIGTEIVKINEEAQVLREEMSLLCRRLGDVLRGAGVSDRRIMMIGEDPIKLVAIAISIKHGFHNGIDPNLFPDLV